MQKRKSMVGRQFNRLTVLAINHWKPSSTGSRARNYYYKVKCACGTEKIVAGNSMTSGGTKSCGCLKLETPPPAPPVKLPPGESAFRRCLWTYTSKAKKENIPFNITKSEFKEILAKPCAYCRALPSNTSENKGGNGAFIYSGIDRVDNELGYVPGNVVPCCRQCNVAKCDYTVQEFLAWAVKVYTKLVFQDKEP